MFLTYLINWFLTYLITYLLTYLLTYLRTLSFTYYFTYFYNYLLTLLLIYLLSNLFTYLTYFLDFLLTYFLLTYSLTPWSTVLLEKPPVLQPVKKFPAFYGTRRFITAFTSARHLSLSWASSIYSVTPHSTSWRSILILSFYLRQGLPKWSLSLRFRHQNPVYASPLPHTRYIPHPSHSSRFIIRVTLDEEYVFITDKLGGRAGMIGERSVP